MSLLFTKIAVTLAKTIFPTGGGTAGRKDLKPVRHSEEQIIAVLQEAQAGSTIEELCRRHGISAATYYKWKQKFGGLEVKDAQRLRLLEEENRKLKKLVADQALDNMVLKELLGKKS